MEREKGTSMEINLKDFQRIKILRGIEIIKNVGNVEKRDIPVLSVLVKQETRNSRALRRRLD